MTETRHIADLHTHTLVSHHAYSTLVENAREAKRQGLQMLAVTDHCYGAPDAGNRWHFANEVIWPRFIEGVLVLRGIEANIMTLSGTLDAAQSDLRAVDYVVASLHPYCVTPGTVCENMRALNAVLENPLVHTIGHPADMKFHLDLNALARDCAQAGKRLELNEHAMARFDEIAQLNVGLLEACAKYGTKIVLASDAHICFEVGRFKRANALLDRLGFPHELIFSDNPLDVLRTLHVPLPGGS